METLTKILIPGADLTARVIDMNDPEVIAQIEETKKQQAAIMEYKEKHTFRYPYR